MRTTIILLIAALLSSCAMLPPKYGFRGDAWVSEVIGNDTTCSKQYVRLEVNNKNIYYQDSTRLLKTTDSRWLTAYMLTVTAQDKELYRIVLGNTKKEPWLLLLRHEGSNDFVATGFACLKDE